MWTSGSVTASEYVTGADSLLLHGGPRPQNQVHRLAWLRLLYQVRCLRAAVSALEGLRAVVHELEPRAMLEVGIRQHSYTKHNSSF